MTPFAKDDLKKEPVSKKMYWMSPLCGNAWHPSAQKSFVGVAKAAAQKFYEEDPCLHFEFNIFVKCGDTVKEFTVKNQVYFVVKER